MNRKDVIENLKNRLNDLHNGYQTYLEHGGKQDIETENDIEALNMAIEVLEKQIPIRPIMRMEERGFNKGCIYPHCPICDTMPVPHPNVSYCDKCGQAIDWSESE